MSKNKFKIPIANLRNPQMNSLETKSTSYLLKKIMNFVAIISSILLISTLLGSLTSFGHVARIPPRSWEKYDAELVERIRSVEDIGLEAIQRTATFSNCKPEEKMTALYEIVINRLVHGEAKHNFFGNWILFGAGLIFPPIQSIWSPELLLQRSNSAICNQAADILVQAALRNGILARNVGLNGHVVMEAWFENEWHYFDPDLEVLPKESKSSKIMDVQDISLNHAALARFFPGEKAAAIPFLRTREDNSFISYPKGAGFIWKADVLKIVERIAEVLKYLVPVSVLFLCFKLRRKT